MEVDIFTPCAGTDNQFQFQFQQSVFKQQKDVHVLSVTIISPVLKLVQCAFVTVMHSSCCDDSSLIEFAITIKKNINNILTTTLQLKSVNFKFTFYD